jgi:membrane protein
MQRDDALRIGKRFIGEFKRDDVPGLAAELAYRFLFAIFPFGIFVAALSAFVANAIGFQDPTSQIMGSLADNLPAEVASGIRPQLEAVLNQSQPGLLTFGAVAALWAATGGMNALIKAMNRAWEVDETRSFLPKTALAIGLTVLGSLGILGAFVTIVGASLLTQQVGEQLGIGGTTVQIINLLRWPAVFVLLAIAVGILYRLAPNFRAPWRWCFAGGAVFAVTWTLATWLFSLYVANFANYANTYGALGGVIVLMLWFYLTGILLVASAALMAAALKELQPTLVNERRVERGVSAEGVRGSGVGSGVGSGAGAGPSVGGGAGPGVGPVRPGVPATVAMATKEPPEAGEPIPAPASPTPTPSASASATERPRTAPTRRRAPATYRMSGPDDWAVAGFVAATGAAIGAAMAWLVGPHHRSS